METNYPVTITQTPKPYLPLIHENLSAPSSHNTLPRSHGEHRPRSRPSQWCTDTSGDRLSPSIFSTPLKNPKSEGTSSSDLCNLQTLTLWTSSAQVCLYLVILWDRWMLTVVGSSRLFCNHNRLLACSDSRFVRRVLKRIVPTNWWKSAVNRGSVTAVLKNHTDLLHIIHRQFIPSKELVSRCSGSPGFLHALYYTRITWSF